MEKTADTIATMICHHCGKTASYQLIYSLNQVEHVLGKSPSQVKSMIRTGKLKFRYELKSGWCVKRVVDYFQLQSYLNDHLPRPEDLESSEELTSTKRSIARILAWHRKGQNKSKAAIERKMAEKRRQTEPD